MALNTPKRLSDGFSELSGGVDSGRNPTIQSEMNPLGLMRNQVAWAVNTTFRGGKAHPRPPYKQVPLTFPEGDDVRERFEDNLFQGAEFYYPDLGDPLLVLSIGGRLFRADFVKNQVQEIALDELNATLLPHAWMTQAEETLVIQNGQDKPIFFDGGGARRAGNDEIPVGRMMAYGMGRLWIAIKGNAYVAGDLAYGNGRRDNVLNYTENQFLAGGGAFPVGSPITGMHFTQNIDTSLGQGELIVYTTERIFATRAPLDRVEWQNLSIPLQRFIQINHGGVSQWSVANVNSDLWYRATDGIRSLILAQRDYNSWGNLPQSGNVGRAINADNPTLLEYASAVVFNNRLLMTCSPVKTARSIAHRGLVALDFDLLSTLQRKEPPVWEGAWTGPLILRLVRGLFGTQERCFAICVNDAERIEIHEIMKDGRFDNYDERITWFIESPAFTFGNPFQLERLWRGDVWYEDLFGELDMDVKFKPDNWPFWVDWHEDSQCATHQFCDDPLDLECKTVKTYQPQYRPRIKLPQPQDDPNSITGGLLRDAYKFAVRLQFSGNCKLSEFRMQSQQVEETAEGVGLK